MQSLPTPATPRKAFYSFLEDQHGILTQDDAGQIWFRNSETDALTAITPAHLNYL